MRWKGRRKSENVQDSRAMSPKAVGVGGLGMVVILVIMWLLGADPRALMEVAQNNPGGGGGQQQQQGEFQETPEERELVEFVSVVLADTEDVWKEIFSEQGAEYVIPKLEIYRESVRSACGLGQAETGPFYCPADSIVYLDLSFFQQMEDELRAPGDFAQAYVIAHEVGHHVQNLMGISDEVTRRQQTSSEEIGNQWSVRLELQADYFAGVWAHHADQNWNILEQGDVEEALRAATAIGDDRLQQQSRGYSVPESFTHGTSAQRAKWFRLGLQTGDMRGGNALFELDYDDL